MKTPAPLIAAAALLLAASITRAEDWLDRLDQSLTFNAAEGKVRAHVSGLVDAEGYLTQKPAPGLVFSNRTFLFNPRLTLFLDAQLGSHLYAFAQARFDHGFDPGYTDAQVRLDEYFLSVKPWEDGRVRVQAGKFATVAGNWVQRHDSWTNPFITAPLPYENLTGMWDGYPVGSADTLFNWSHRPDSGFDTTGADKHLRIPVIWGPSYASGLAVFGQLGKFDLAGEVKNASLSSRPGTWDATAVGFSHPSFTARFAFRPDPAWNLGVFGSTGSYLDHAAQRYVAKGFAFDDYRQTVIGQDISFAWHHWQIWAETFATRFEIPGVGNADTLAYYVEAKYKFTPQLFGAFRWNQHVFGTLPDGAGGCEKWGGDIWRTDFAVGYRFTAHTQLKLQYSLERRAADIAGFANTFAAQFTIRF